jgi:Flp pilus assembly protein TadG
MSQEMHTRDFGSSLRRFLVDDAGSTTVEFVFMVPLFTTFLLLAADSSMLFLRQTTLMNVARDTARAVSRHAMTEAEGQAYAQTAAANGQGAAVASVTTANGIVTVVISTNAQSAAPFGIVKYAVGETISATASNTLEPI